MEVTNSGRDKYLRALPQIIASASLFYIIIFINFSSPRLSFMLHSLKLYLLAIPLHSLDKSWVFLICNALLLFVLGFFPSSRADTQNYHNAPEEEHDVLLLESAHEPDFEGLEDDDHHLHACIWEEKEADGSGGSSRGDLGITVEEEEEKDEVVTEIIICITEGDGDDDEEDESSGFEYEDELQEDEELEEERVCLEKLSAEELNKKFDDFITKMKEELRIDAQQQHLVRCY